MEFDMAAPGFEKIASPESEADADIIATVGGFGEGPVWNKRTGELYWVSILGNTYLKRFPTCNPASCAASA